MKKLENYARHADGEKTASTQSVSPTGGHSLIFIYVNTAVPGLSWENLNVVLPDDLVEATCLHQTKSSNAILAFRSVHAKRDYQRLASHGQTEVMVLMDETTLWGHELVGRLISSGLKLYELPVLSNDQERQLLRFLTILAKGSGLNVALKNDVTGPASTALSTASVVTPHIDLP